jgi:hypothetical protein
MTTNINGWEIKTLDGGKIFNYLPFNPRTMDVFLPKFQVNVCKIISFNPGTLTLPIN